ncbi:MAG: TIGR01459 family HAD-type hydrolase [Rhodospirillaceae bacterium]|nr:TIGR01459 family HAD-type hydrolase [Rhodospirillaceae bacterium]
MTHLRGLAEIAGRYDGFILDLWGLIHDGETPYPTARATLAALKAAGKKTLLLSNAPRRAHALIDALGRMGIGRELYGEVLSSGEATRDALIARDDPAFAKLGRRAYHLGPERDRSVFEDTGLDVVATPEEADFVVNTGPTELHHQIADYEAAMARAAAKKLPMVCANPDLVVLRGGKPVVCAGALAARYAEMGCEVLYRGKPDPAIYHLAVKRLGIADAARVAVVGDALETDVKGARAAGLDAIWCTGGIHAAALGCSYGVAADPAKAEALAASFSEAPTASIPGFVW